MLAVKISRAQASHNSPVLSRSSMSTQMSPSSSTIHGDGTSTIQNQRLLNCVPKELESLMVFVYALVMLIVSVFIYVE